MSATMMLAKLLDELDIGQPTAECLLMALQPRGKLVFRGDELRPVQGWAEDTDERVMTSHTEMCQGCEVTSVEEGHEVERVTVRSDVVKRTDQRKKMTIATVKAFNTKLTNAEDDIQQTSLHVCSTSGSLTRWESNSWQGNILATRRRRMPGTKLLPSAVYLRISTPYARTPRMRSGS